MMKNALFLVLATCLFTLHSCGQNASQQKEAKATDVKVWGSCEGCEAIYESPIEFDKLPNLIRLPDWSEDSSNRIAINGVVYKEDGKTPAAGVIIYIYHTDQTGVYPTKGDEKGWAKRHGYLRGWMKTDEKGEYKFWTRRPASYPNSKNPQHIHVIIKEPGKTPYWIDEYLFDDDPNLTEAERKNLPNRGGSGILLIKPYYVGKPMLKSERHIYLGRNIDNYPKG
jgi:protocatechuate 3,4-dioxygenase beta subunit